MTQKKLRAFAAVALFAALAFAVVPRAGSAPPMPAQTAASRAPLHVFASNAVKALLDDLGPQCEKAAGRPLAITYSTSATIKKELSAGESFDVVVGTADLIDGLLQQGKISAGSHADIARAAVGVGAVPGARIDVATSEAMKRALLAAKAVALTDGGASVPFVMNMAAKMGIVDQVKAKALYGSTTTAAAQDVIDGKADLVFTMVPEILPIKGLKLLGPIPAQYDRYLNFSAGVSTNSANAKAGAALIHYLDSRAVLPTLKAKGLEPVKKSS